MDRVLESLGVPTPPRIECNRDGGPKVEFSLQQKYFKKVLPLLSLLFLGFFVGLLLTGQVWSGLESRVSLSRGQIGR